MARTLTQLRKHIGEQLCLARKHRKLSQEELGNLIGKEQNTISRYETGKALSLETLYDLSEFFDVPISFFFDTFTDYNVGTNYDSLQPEFQDLARKVIFQLVKAQDDLARTPKRENPGRIVITVYIEPQMIRSIDNPLMRLALQEGDQKMDELNWGVQTSFRSEEYYEPGRVKSDVS